MSRLRIAALLAALATLPLLAPPAAASPCASPCGEVEIALNCVTVTVVAEGAGGGVDTVWQLVVHESWNYAGGRTYRSPTQTGPVASFHYSNTVPAHWIYNVDAYLHADGAVVASSHWGCYNP